MQQLTTDHLTGKKQTEEKFKTAFSLKLLELCKTRATKSSPDMFNFYEDLTGHAMVTDAGRATSCRRIMKAPSLQTKSTKNEGPPENMGFNMKTVWRFQMEKRTETIFSTFQKTHCDTRTLKPSTEMSPL